MLELIVPHDGVIDHPRRLDIELVLGGVIDNPDAPDPARVAQEPDHGRLVSDRGAEARRGSGYG